MPIKTLELPIIGQLAYYALAGTVISESTVGRDFKPVTSPPTGWTSLGPIEEAVQEHSFEGETQHMAFIDGRYRNRKTTYTGSTFSIALLCQDMDAMMQQLLMGAKSVDNEGNYVPDSLAAPLEGWLKVQKYISGPNTHINTLDIYGQFSITDGRTDSVNVTKPRLQVRLIYSPLQSGRFPIES